MSAQQNGKNLVFTINNDPIMSKPSIRFGSALVFWRLGSGRLLPATFRYKGVRMDVPPGPGPIIFLLYGRVQTRVAGLMGRFLFGPRNRGLRNPSSSFI